ncbi:hypothetical protein ID866_3677 [Astraeus odoratus]|nr:hypothetical protein ID866_3677 [Astraeus odoratus]
MWRSTTFLILVDLCSPAPQPTQPYITLDKYSDLLHCYTKHRRSRITLASDTKPFVRSHYAETRVPSEESRVCVKNALDFHYYDAKTSTQAVNAFNKLDISSLCSYHIPCGPYRNLQKYLQDTTHTSNDVLCNQADCHKNLAIHEYIAFGHLRCGPLLQWLNILREIRANIMTFRHDEVHMLFAQAASQIGPLSDSGELSWHHELELPSFRRSLLTELEALVSAVSGNWLEGMTMTTISFLTSRILAAMVMSENGADTSRRAHQLLLRVREETFSWVLELSHKLDNTTNEDEKHGIQGRLRDMAAICRSTFDVGVDDAMVLTDPSRAIEILLSCSILIHDNTPTNIADIATMSRLLLERDHRLSWKLQQVMSSFIEKGDGGIDLAIKHRVLDVVPADVEGMEYATRGLVSGHRVYFRMAGDELILRAKEESDSDIFELIPPQKLGSDLPVVLIENHVHWLNLSTHAIEVRPLEKLWQQSPGNWHIHFVPGNYYMEKGCSKLLDIRSPAWRMISSRLQPLEESHNLIITLTANNPSDTVCVELPRYGLTFIINDSGELESRNMRDMVYDDMQSIGTMFGLVNRLVLRPKNDIANDPRCVLIPEGAVSFTEHGHHVRVWVDTKGSSKRMNYQTFWIDTDMGCLTGSVSLANKLYRAYLHALTSNPYSVDPLTKKTGTEEALSILHSAASRSFIKIDARSAGLLSCIASLTTERKWYPPHLKRMQNVKWGDQATLPVASRHHGLYLSCVSVKAIHESLHVFSDQKILPVFKDFPTREQDLLERASLRAAMLYPPEFRDLASDDTSDTSYKARDVLQHAPAEGRAYRVALAVYSWSPCKSAMANVQTLLQCWRGPLAGITTGTVSMRYSRDWLAPDLPTTWLLLYDTCRQTRKEQGRFQLLFSLSAMAYSSSDLDGVAHTLLAFAVMPQFRIENPPLHRSYDLSDGHIPSAEKLQSFVQACAASFMMSPEQTREEYRQRTRRDRASAVANLISHWPRKTAPPCDFLDNSLYNIELLSPKIQKLFASCYQNWELKQHFGRVQSILDQMPPSSPDGLSYYSFIPATSPFRSPGMPAINDLFHRPVPDLPVTGVTLQVVTMPIQSSSSGSEALRQLIDTLRQKSTNFQAKYINDLRESENHLFKMHYLECRDAYFSCLQAISESLGPQTKSEHAIQESVAKFGLEYQRARRMLLLATNGHFEDLCKEMENTGCDGWNANSYPDWLLIQLEGNFLIRRIQANVAFEMIAPQSGENTALQLHMGEGKSSVIVPMAALALADGDQLVRVVVPKALITQMYQLLVDRLGGLTNRRIYHIPFSRSLQMDQSRVKMLQIILDECRRERGILVAQPDHILSFKLMSVEKQLRQDNDVADELLKTQRWLHLHVRDILDESDEILHVRNQMVYTIGSQQLLQGFPERWSTTQQMLNLVKKHASSLQEAFPHGVEHETRHPGAFPHFRILQADAGQDLITTLARDVMDGLLPNHSFNQASYNVRSAIFSFITKVDVGPSDVQEVQHYSGDTRIWTALLHLRGLLASGILLFALKERRWRVDFGLAPWRTMLAVPYRAKDVPAARAEFGHPDVAVTLTCLSYYYEGLTQEQLMVCFERLLQLDDPTQEYELWSPVPPCLSQLSGINIESSEQWKDYLVPNFSHNKATIDFYLSQVVFPKEAKEFRFKLSCSGWDLAEERAHVTTGTNDGRYLLPMSISQRDPDHQRGTNAKVLAYLLQTENDAYMQTSLPNGERRTARELLELVVLELQNNEFAAAWLELKPDALAAIYFDDNDELTVLTREGSTQLLFESSFAHRLDECVVYLDDAHTRGTDIRFPAGFRAAVTLGPKVTKDRLTQGCMRMRKLGNGHSVMFFAPLDVDRSIRDTVSKKESDDIHTTDILQWTMLETCTEIQSKAPLWVQQGTDHTSRYDAWSTFCETGSTVERLKAVWRQRDARTLEELYGPASPRELSSISIPAIRQRCLDLGILSLPDSNMAEEQEREVVHEIERERQVERPSKATPAVHLFSQGVLDFVRTGRMAPMSVPMQPIFDSIDSVAMPYHDKYAWTWRIFATPDFCRVVQGNEDAIEYLRPVNWILSAESSESDVVLVLISPFEANLLMPAIRSSDFVNLHIYTPRTHKVMRPCDDLRLYTVPPLPPGCTMPPPLIDQLNLFAGQLYLHDYSTYIRVCRFLCVNTRDLEHEGEFEVQNDGFIEPAHRPVKLMSRSTFQRSPLPFLRWLIGLRRKGMGFALTHMGKIVDGRLLREEDFETFRTGA